MTALANKRGRKQEQWSFKQFTLTLGTKAWQGGLACLDKTTGKVTPGAASTTLLPIGWFAETIDASTAEKLVNVELLREVTIEWLANAAAPNAVAATDVGSMGYILDDNTATITATSHSLLGRIWGVDSTKGVAVELLDITETELDLAAYLAIAGQVNVPLAAFAGADGTALAKFADNAASNPGLHLADSKSFCLRWNNNGTQAAVLTSIPLPQDLDDTKAITLNAFVSKNGATVGDAVKLTVGAFFQTAASLHDADADCGGDSNALTGNATAKTITKLSLTIAAADVPAAPCALTITIKPKDGTLGTDDAMVHAVWIEYSRKAA